MNQNLGNVNPRVAGGRLLRVSAGEVKHVAGGNVSLLSQYEMARTS